MSGGTAKAHSIVARRAVASTEKAAAEPVLARTDRKTRSSSARRLGGGSDRPADVSDDQLSYLEPTFQALTAWFRLLLRATEPAVEPARVRVA